MTDVLANPNWAQLPLFDRSKWETMRFGDVVELVSETSRNPEAEGITRYIGLEHLEPGSLHIKTWGELVDGVTFTKRCRKGQVLFGKRRAYQRKVVIAEFDALVSGDIYVFQAKEELLDPKLLPFICMSERFFQYAVETSAGSLSPRTNWSHLAEFEFALPPHDQQRRIAELLWAVDELRERYSATNAMGMRMIDSALSELLYKAGPWPMLRCEDILVDGPRNGYSPQAEAGGKGLPTLSISSIRDGKVIFEGNLKYAAVSDEEVASYFLKAEDMLVVRGNGNKQLCGRAGLVSEPPDQCFYPDLLIRLRFDRDVLLPEFAVQLWNEPETFARLISRAKSSNGIWKINGKDVKAHELPVPSIQAQERFLKASGTRRAVVKAAQTAFDSATHFRTALLNSFITA